MGTTTVVLSLLSKKAKRRAAANLQRSHLALYIDRFGLYDFCQAVVRDKTLTLFRVPPEVAAEIAKTVNATFWQVTVTSE
jgi:hypothetical protein